MKPAAARVFGVLAASVGLTTLGLVVLAAALLRESPLFWHNAGGYSEDLRALVRIAFYPAVVIYFTGIMSGSFIGWRLLRAGRRSGGVLLLACAFNWLLFAAITTMVLCNNIENLLQGHPLHYHAP